MDMTVSPALLVDRVLQTQQDQTVQAAQMGVLKTALNLQASASAAVLQAVAGPLPLATGGTLGTQLNTLA